MKPNTSGMNKLTMESIFYVTKQAVTLSEIAQISENLGIDSIFIPTNDTNFPATIEMKFGYSGSEVPVFKWCRWEQISLNELEDIDEDSMQRLHDLGVKSIFCLETRAATFPDLLPLLKILLEKYDGWVDCHDDFAELLDLQTIDQLPNIFPFVPRTEAQVLEEEFATLSYMWTTEKNDWVLFQIGGDTDQANYLPYNTDTRLVANISHPDLYKQVIQAMLQAGTQIITELPDD